MKLERIQTIQRLPVQIEEAWDFFTSPKNLKLISPHWLDYRLTSEPPEYLHPGTIISASIRPIPVISSNWISEITHIRPPQFYITEQRFGPFKMWHHEHHFRAIDEGVEVEDIILYGMHYGIVGSFVHNVFVRKKLHDIFSYRAQMLEQRFGTIHKPRTQEKRKPTIEEIFQSQTQQRQHPQKQTNTPQLSQPPTLGEHALKEKPRSQNPLQQNPQQPDKSHQRPLQQKTQKKKPLPQSLQQQNTLQQNTLQQNTLQQNTQQQKPGKPAPPTQPSKSPGKPEPKRVTLDDIFRGTED